MSYRFHVRNIFCQTDTKMYDIDTKSQLRVSSRRTKQQTSNTTGYITEYLRYFENIQKACSPLYIQVFFNNVNCGMCVADSEWWWYLVAGVKILVVGERQVRGALVVVRGGGGGATPPVPRGYNSAIVTL